jgi:hypothetical protein
VTRIERGLIEETESPGGVWIMSGVNTISPLGALRRSTEIRFSSRSSK